MLTRIQQTRQKVKTARTARVKRRPTGSRLTNWQLLTMRSSSRRAMQGTRKGAAVEEISSSLNLPARIQIALIRL